MCCMLETQIFDSIHFQFKIILLRKFRKRFGHIHDDILYVIGLTSYFSVLETLSFFRLLCFLFFQTLV